MRQSAGNCSTTVAVIAFGFALDNDVKYMATVVYNEDKTVESRKLLDMFVNTDTFRITREVAGATGLAEGDVIIGINRTRVHDAQQVANLLDEIRPREYFRIYFERGGQVGYTDLTFR